MDALANETLEINPKYWSAKLPFSSSNFAERYRVMASVTLARLGIEFVSSTALRQNQLGSKVQILSSISS